MEIMTPHDAAVAVKREMADSPRPRSFSAVVMEGLHIPDDTFDDFVRECQRLGLTVHTYWLNECAVIGR